MASQIIPNKPRASFQKGNVLVSKYPRQPSHTRWEMRDRVGSDGHLASSLLPGTGHQAGGPHNDLLNRFRFTEAENQQMLESKLKLKFMTEETLMTSINIY